VTILDPTAAERPAPPLVGGPGAPGAPAGPAGLATALPVELVLRGRSLESVRRAVEGTLGWQPVDGDTATLVPPALRLLDVGGAVDLPRTASRSGHVPSLLLVGAADAPVAVARAVMAARPSEVLGWPADTTELAAAAARATAGPLERAPGVATVRLGGAAGGAGTTTVALALAGFAAWRGHAALVASADALLLPAGAPLVEPGALAAPDLWSRAVPVTGVPALRTVRTLAPALDVGLTDPAIGVAVLDLGPATEVDVLVCRPDAHGVAALATTTAAAAVVVGSGPVADRELSVAAGPRRTIRVPWSARVARAAVVGRVPAALPGRFVRSLRPLVPSGDPGG
jgi:hypothetical protein